MIDATKSPLPAWRKYLMIAVLAVFIVIAGYFLWTKELHKSSSPSPSSTPTTATVPANQTPVKGAPATTVPGGVAVSNRNPFGS